LKGQNKYKYAVASNIFYNCSNKKIYGNMTNNKNQVAAANNVYLWDGEFFAETKYNDDEGVQLDPQFKSPTPPADLKEGEIWEASFRPTNLAFLNLKDIPGDPRWTKWVY
jgi:hypothetical protein